MDEPRILVKIAAYRDPELPKTIRSALTQADRPELLRFAIVNQHDIMVDEISLAEWANDPRFRVTNVLHTQSSGLGWARYLCDQMWAGEDFSLQIDSHMRFDSGWDATLVEDWRSRDDEFAVLTGHPKGYCYDDDGNEVTDPDFGAVALYVNSVNDLGESTLGSSPFSSPEKRVLLVAGGFQFAPGSTARTVTNDRRLQYGEELIQSLKLYTSGYNVYAARAIPISHFYHRAERMNVRLPAQDATDPNLARIKANIRALSVETNLDYLFGSGNGLGTARTRAAFLKNLHGYMGIAWPQAWADPALETDEPTTPVLVATHQEQK